MTLLSIFRFFLQTLNFARISSVITGSPTLKYDPIGPTETTFSCCAFADWRRVDKETEDKKSFTKSIIRRSALIMPVTNSRLVEKSYLRGADAICLDMEDSVPLNQKQEARRVVKESISTAGMGGMDVLVRINNTGSLTMEDLEASVWPGLSGLILPKIESVDRVNEIADKTRELELARGMKDGSVLFWVVVETAKGVKNSFEIAESCPERISHIGVGDEDLSLELDITPTTEGGELSYVKSRIIIAARVAGITPLGLAGTLSDFADLEGLRRSATKAKGMGFKGAMAIHPSQVPILNEIFSPAPDIVAYSKRVIAAYEKALVEGKGTVQLEGKMIDNPVYERAIKVLKLSQSIESFEQKKRVN